MKYTPTQAHRSEFKLTSICRVLKVQLSGFYAWLHEPQLARAKVNEALTVKIREFYDQNMGIYGSPRIFCDLREAGIVCSENKVARLMRAAGIKSVGATNDLVTEQASPHWLPLTNCSGNSNTTSQIIHG